MAPTRLSEGAGRPAALACFLSHGDGWREALGMLGGAFAPNTETGPVLTAPKEE